MKEKVYLFRHLKLDAAPGACPGIDKGASPLVPS